MRPVMALLLAASALALSGCVADAGGQAWGRDCSTQTGQAVARTADVLLPKEAPSERPTVRVEAREGQTLVANAVWRSTAGQAQAVFDGPSQHLVQVGSTFSSVTSSVPAGAYTLSLEGSPLAQGVSYTLQLVATGCTPA
jgi:hypothetical protein